MNQTTNRWTVKQAAMIREAGARWARRYCIRADRNGSGLPACKACKNAVDEFRDCRGRFKGWRDYEVMRMRAAKAIMLETERVE